MFAAYICPTFDSCHIFIHNIHFFRTVFLLYLTHHHFNFFFLYNILFFICVQSKAELFLIPYFSCLLSALGGIAIDRRNRERAIRYVCAVCVCVHVCVCVCVCDVYEYVWCMWICTRISCQKKTEFVILHFSILSFITVKFIYLFL